MNARISEKIAKYIIEKINEVRPDLVIDIQSDHDGRYSAQWKGTLTLNWGPLNDYNTEKFHPEFVSFYWGGFNESKLEMEGGGDGFFSDARETIDVPDASSDEQLRTICRDKRFIRIVESAVTMAKKIKPLDKASIPGYKIGFRK